MSNGKQPLTGARSTKIHQKESHAHVTRTRVNTESNHGGHGPHPPIDKPEKITTIHNSSNIAA